MKPSKIIFGTLLVILSIAIVSSFTSISDSFIDLDSGEIRGVDFITITENPLAIIDGGQNMVRAIFSSSNQSVFQLAQTMNEPDLISPNTSIAFFGDVSNFDNVNGASRFREFNLNNGSGATAGFTAVNDLGNTATFGLTSSGFFQGPKKVANAGSIVLDSPSSFNYVNFFFTGWTWKVDDNNSTSFRSVHAKADLSPEGNFNITGNFTGNQLYGEMFFFDFNGEFIPITNATQAPLSLFNITGFDGGSNNGFIFDNVTDSLIALRDGLYRAHFTLSYQNSPNSRHGFALLVNGVVQPNVVSATIVTNNNDIATPSADGLVRLQTGDRVQLGVGDRFSPPNGITVISSNVNLIRIGH